MTPAELLEAAQQIARDWPDAHIDYSGANRLTVYDSMATMWPVAVIDRNGFETFDQRPPTYGPKPGMNTRP